MKIEVRGTLVEPHQAPTVARALRLLESTTGGLPLALRPLLDELNAAAAAVTTSGREAQREVGARSATSRSGQGEVSEEEPALTIDGVTWFSPSQVAHRLGMTKRGATDLCSRGTLDAVRIGSRWAVHAAVVEDYAARERTTTR